MISCTTEIVQTVHSTSGHYSSCFSHGFARFLQFQVGKKRDIEQTHLTFKSVVVFMVTRKLNEVSCVALFLQTKLNKLNEEI